MSKCLLRQKLGFVLALPLFPKAGIGGVLRALFSSIVRYQLNQPHKLQFLCNDQSLEFRGVIHSRWRREPYERLYTANAWQEVPRRRANRREDLYSATQTQENPFNRLLDYTPSLSGRKVHHWKRSYLRP